jgi:hypothetical protein
MVSFNTLKGGGMITKDAQVKGLFMSISEGKPLYLSAQRADICENTARKYVRNQRFPSDLKQPHTWRTRPDAFSEVWPRIEVILSEEPQFEAKSAFEWLQREYPGKFPDSQLRTLQRRFRHWHATKGNSREVFFDQEHSPGQLGASDFTWMTELGVTIAGLPFDHMLYHYVLTWSNWEHGTICFSESFESMSAGLQNALWRCGGVPEKHRTDRLSAAVNNLDEKRDFTIRYEALLRHHSMIGQKTNPNSGNENGDAEQRHYRLKSAVKQALIIRGSRDFSSRGDYEHFLDQLFDRLNEGRKKRFEEERRHLKPLPARRLADYTEIRGVLVGKGSTITVRKKVYSVHSRLCNEHVTVRLYAECLEVLFGSTVVETLPRLRGTDSYRINYRHIIDWLVRKPGAFANYRYRSELFPTSHFRIAYDILREQNAPHADKEYLQILYCAARQSEDAVNRALQKIISEGTALTAASVTVLVQWLGTSGIPQVIDTPVAEVNLAQYDNLLGFERRIAV